MTLFPIDWSKLLLFEAISIGVGLIIYHGVAAFYHRRYYLQRKNDPEAWKCQPKRFLRDKMAKKAVVSGTLNMTLGGFLSGLFMYAVDAGLPTKIYFDWFEYGWAYLFLSGIGLFLVVDMSAYWVHRAFHIKFMFKHFHRFHHKFIAPTPYAAIALHPLELFALQAAAFAALFIVPLHPAVFGAVLIYILIFNIIDHSGVDLRSTLPWQPPSRYHDDHHVHFHVNFGQHLLLWDRIFGTLKRQGRSYGKDVFGGKGLPDGSDAPDAYEDY